MREGDRPIRGAARFGWSRREADHHQRSEHRPVARFHATKDYTAAGASSCFVFNPASSQPRAIHSPIGLTSANAP